MTWFFLALVGPILFAISNHIDKFLIEKYFKNSSIGSLMMYSSLIGIIVAPILFLIKPNILNIGINNALILIALGISGYIVIWLYMKAMQNDEASVVVPFFQLIPVFAYIMGYFVLGEVLSTKQIIAMVIIILGATILSIEIDEENKFKLRKQTLLLMTIACLISATEQVIFKHVILQEDFWISSFWTYVGLALIGVFIFLFSKEYRVEFIDSIKNNSKRILMLNLSNEAINTVGNIAMSFAYLLAPLALVLLVGAYQPVFVFIIGILLTIFFPKIAKEEIKLKHITQKILVLVVMGFGTYLLFV